MLIRIGNSPFCRRSASKGFLGGEGEREAVDEENILPHVAKRNGAVANAHSAFATTL